MLAASLAGIVAGGSASARDLDFSVMAGSRVAGMMNVHDGGTQRVVEFQYEDRGRGPKLIERVRFGEHQRPASIDIQGLDYFHSDASEHFGCTGAIAAWSSPIDHGSAKCEGFYLNNAQVPEDAALLARALLAAPDRTLTLLPQGAVHLEPLLKRSLQHGKNAVEVSLYAIHGAGLLPILVWLDADNQLFLTNYADSPTIRKGWEDETPDLLAQQDAAMQALLASATERARTEAAGDLLIRHVALFDAKARKIRPGMSVLVRRDRIEAVGPDLKAPADAKIIDGSGQTLLPGLWDMHTHLSNLSQGFLDLGAGITSARDMGNSIERLTRYANWFQDGTIAGPRVFKVGLIDGPGPLAAPIDTLAATPEQMNVQIDHYVALGYEQIKLYSSVKPELVPGAIASAHRHCKRISGHVPAGMTAGELVDEGFDELQHMNFLLLNFYPDAKDKTATPARFTVVGDRAGTLDLDSAPVQQFIAELKAHDIVIDPTMAFFEQLYTPDVDKTRRMTAVFDQLPALDRRANLSSGLAHDAASAARYKAAWETMRHMLVRLYAAGIRLVPGTDELPGFTYQRELEVWSEAGLRNADILYDATLGAASVNGHQKELGSVEPGKLADMVLVKGNPLARMSDIRNVTLTIKNGDLYDPAALHRAINVTPLHTPQ